MGTKPEPRAGGAIELEPTAEPKPTVEPEPITGLELAAETEGRGGRGKEEGRGNGCEGAGPCLHKG